MEVDKSHPKLVAFFDFVIDTAALLLLQRSDRMVRILHAEIE